MSTFQQFKRLLIIQWKMYKPSPWDVSVRQTDARAFWRRLGLSVLVLFGAGSLLVSYGVLLSSVMGPAAKAGQGGLILGFVFLLTMLMVLLLGVFSMLTALWGARDVEMLAALPLHPQAVFLSKMAVLYLGHLGVTLFFTLPALILYAVHVPTGLWFWFAGLVAVLLLPLLPMILSALLSLGLMLLTALTRRRELWTVLGGLLLIAALLAGQSALQGALGSGPIVPENVQQMLLDNEAMLRAVTGAFPPAMWAAGALTLTDLSSAALYFVAYLSCALLGLWLAVFAAGRLFFRVSLSQMESARGNMRARHRAGGVRTRGVGKTLFWREYKILTRTPVYLINGVLGPFVFPLLILVMPLLAGNMQADALRELMDMIDGMPPAGVTLLLTLLLLLPAILNPAVSTAVSREGRTLWMMRQIPVPMETQIRCKLGFCWVLALCGQAAMWAALCFGMGLDPTLCSLALLLAAALGLPATLAGGYPDLNRPKLFWHSENEAMKMNVNSLTGMGLSLLCALLAAAVAVPLALCGLSLPWITLSLLVVSTALTPLWYRTCMRAVKNNLCVMDI